MATAYTNKRALTLAVTTAYQTVRADICGDHRFARRGSANAIAFHISMEVKVLKSVGLCPVIMAASLLQQIDVIGRLLGVIDGAQKTQVGREQSAALFFNIERVKWLSDAEKNAIMTAIQEVPFDGDDMSRLLTAVSGKCNSGGRKRPMQDYMPWSNYCTRRVWQSIAESPSMATEIICQHVANLGLINPSKDTQKSIAAHAVVAEFERSLIPMSAGDPQRVFKTVGKRLKQLYNKEPLEYITQLPPSPAQFLREHPLMAKAFLFS